MINDKIVTSYKGYDIRMDKNNNVFISKGFNENIINIEVATLDEAYEYIDSIKIVESCC